MTPEQAIADLDDSLSQHGTTIILQRMTPAPNGAQVFSAVTCKALLRGYAPSDMIGNSGITQQDQVVIISPSEINEAQWPGGAPDNAPGDKRVPRAGDRIRSQRGTMTIQAASGIYMQDTLVRINISARGS